MSRPYLYVSRYITISKCSIVYRVKSELRIFDRNVNLKYRYERRNFWTRGYLVDIVERNEKRIKEYIKSVRR